MSDSVEVYVDGKLVESHIEIAHKKRWKYLPSFFMRWQIFRIDYPVIVLDKPAPGGAVVNVSYGYHYDLRQE